MRSRTRGLISVVVAVLLVAALGAAYTVRAAAAHTDAAVQAAAFNRTIPVPVLDPTVGEPIVTVVGDNMSEVAQSAKPTKEWPLIVSSELKTRIISLSTASSGYTSKPVSWTYGGTFVARAPHVEPESRAVIFFGGANDASAKQSRVYDSALVSVREAKAAAKRASVAIVGPVHTSTELPADLTAVRNTLKRAAKAAGVPFIDPIAQHWVDGKKGVFQKDGISLTEDGQQLVAARMQKIIAGLLD